MARTLPLGTPMPRLRSLHGAMRASCTTSTSRRGLRSKRAISRSSCGNLRWRLGVRLSIVDSQRTIRFEEARMAPSVPRAGMSSANISWQEMWSGGTMSTSN